MKQGKKGKERLVDILNPSNLQKKIDSYGYNFTIGKYLSSVLLSIAATLVFGWLFSLKWECMVVLAIVITMMLPSIILTGYKNMYEHKRFIDLSDYMEQILYSFKVHGKIVSALKDTKTLFDGKMNTAIQEAYDYIEKGRTESKDGDLYREALGKIERQYPNEHLSTIHSYLQVVEKNGGDTDGAIDLLIQEKNTWADNVLLLQEDKKRSRTHVFVAIFITMAVAATFHGVYSSMPNYNVVENPVVQVATTIYILMNIFIWQRSNKELSKSWIERERDKKAEHAVEYVKTLKEWDEKREQKKSFVMAAPFFVAIIPLLFFEKIYFGIAMLLVGIFMLNQHKLGYKVAYNVVAKEINIAFPKWLMELALLLQGNNVQNSIVLSEETAPEVLKNDIRELVVEIRKNPSSQEPYNNFLKEFQLSSVQSAMKMLYSITENGSGEMEKQVVALVERNGKLLDKAEKMENERKLASMKGLFMAPQLTVTFQVFVTMGVFMLVFLQGWKV